MGRLSICLLALSLGICVVGGGGITSSDILGPYGSVWEIHWDGWEGTLVLRPPTWASYLEQGTNRYAVRYEILVDPQDEVEGMRGPGYVGVKSQLKHRIVFWVDFNRTPKVPKDDQRFDGYIFTQTIKKLGKQAMAGVTWWKGIPFGFYATFKYDVPG